MNATRFGLVASIGMLVSLSSANAGADSRLRGIASNVIAAGYSHAFVLESAGATFNSTNAYAWGTDAHNELGFSSGTVVTPAQIGPQFSRLAAGTDFSIGITYQGAMYGWGETNLGQSGVKVSATNIATPTPIGQIIDPQTGTDIIWKTASAGTNHACAISSDGLLYCWGDDSQGELSGAPSSKGTAVFQAVTSQETPLQPWLAVACGDEFTVALQADGTAWTWGWNNSYQLGTGSKSTFIGIPQKVTIGAATPHWVGIAAGAAHVLAIRDDGTLWAWGLNGNYEIGNGANTTNQPTPYQISGGSGPWIAVSAGAEDSFALKADGTLWAWGENRLGQLGCITGKCASPQKAPYELPGSFQYVVAGSDFTLAVSSSGDLWTWGDNASGQLGNTTAGGNTASTGAQRVPDNGFTFTALKPAYIAGGGGTAGVNADGTTSNNGARIKTSGLLETYGSDQLQALGLSSGQSGTWNIAGTGAGSPGLCDWSSGSARCLGPLPVAYVQQKSAVSVNSVPWVQVATGRTQMLGLRADGTAWGWGQNSSGEVGINSVALQSLPAPITDAKGNPWAAPWLKLFADPEGSTSFGIQANGKLYAWGQYYGQTPVQLCTSGPCSSELWATMAVSSGLGGGALAVATDGTLWGWSPSANGFPSTPTALNATNGPSSWSNELWVDAQSGPGLSAIDANGWLWGWGWSEYGDIGDGTNDAGGTGLAESGGTVDTCASENTNLPPLPNPNSCSATNPTVVLKNVNSVVRCGDESVLALDAVNNLWVWGSNLNDALGVSDPPVQWATNAYTGYSSSLGCGTQPCLNPSRSYWNLENITPILSIACGQGTALVQSIDGEVYVTGSDATGQGGGTCPMVGPCENGGFNSSPSQVPTLQGLPVYPQFYSPFVFNASVNAGSANSVNGNGTWTTGVKQSNGQWFEFDLGHGAAQSPLVYTGIRITSAAGNQYPVAYAVYVSNDATNWTAQTMAWGGAVGSGAGESVVVTMTFPPQTAEYVRIVQTGTSTNPWSIASLAVLY